MHKASACVIGLTVVALLCGGSFAGARPRVDPAMSCEQIDAWIARHQATLPKLYDDFVAYPMAFRRRMFEYLAPATQAALWKTHLARGIETEPDLKQEQREIIETLLRRRRAASSENAERIASKGIGSTWFTKIAGARTPCSFCLARTTRP